jgi:patatin-like phospholipase/acyl hydrolase
VLAHLEKDLNVKVTDHFDLIVGTSTGGIIALGLGSGMSPRELMRFYVENARDIFPDSMTIRIRKWWRNKHDVSPLEVALKKCFRDKLLGNSLKRLVIPSYNTGEDDVYLFKTPHHERLRRDIRVPMWKVALATSAAPTYFPTFRAIDHVRLVDGGIWANNPVMVGITEAVSMLGQPLENIWMLSLGTTDEVKGRPMNLDYGGLWQWRKAAVDVILQGQNRGAQTQAQHLLGQERVIRLDPKVPEGWFALDKLSEKELLGKAAHESRILSPQFKKIFMTHIAPVFTPYHS